MRTPRDAPNSSNPAVDGSGTVLVAAAPAPPELSKDLRQMT